MTDSSAAPGIAPAAIDYERLYRGDEVFPGVVIQRPPWDIGRPQPLLVAFERAGRISGAVLDVGCGPGDTAIYLASLGYPATGFDIAPTAIEQARTRAAGQDVSATFTVADAADLDGLDGPFDTAVSSALLHCLAPDQRPMHAAALARVIRPGGRLIQFCFTAVDHAELYAPYPVAEDELRATFVPPDWSITTLRADHLETITPTEHMLKLFAQRDFHPEFNDEGAMLLPVLVLEAQRI
ncbi:class I SAM-dependent methyltransferase [Nocardia sp. CA-129566]|uniref:class I SAM-dependent methyltransferase n=1 Tax=Nocardia sp. CA-129566 TaxID=3239976 RepID=UPI003D9725EC